MRPYIAAAFIVLLAGCVKGPKGDKGDTGPSAITNYSGLVTSDNEAISVGALVSGSQVSVYVTNNGGSFIQLPFYSSSFNLNLYFTEQPAVIDLFNAKTTGMTNYKIIVINGPSASGMSRLIS